MISGLVREEAKSLSPVKWGNYAGPIRLFWGENFIGLPQKVVRKIKSAARLVCMYPDPEQSALKEELEKYTGMKKENMVVGNGSDALIELLAKTFISKGDEVLVPLPSFITYSNVARLMGGKPVYAELGADLRLDIGKLLEKITTRTKIIFIANPNNPTGNYLIGEADAEKILASFTGILAIDECYFETGGITLAGLVKKYENVVILRSFSKGLALAGLRIGYALASQEAIKYMKTVQNTPQPFEVNAIAQLAAAEALRCRKEITARLISNKEKFREGLSKLEKLRVIDTATSFLLLDFTPAGKTARQIKLSLEKSGILTKDCAIFPNFNENYLYMGIPRKKDRAFVIAAIAEAAK